MNTVVRRAIVSFGFVVASACNRAPPEPASMAGNTAGSPTPSTTATANAPAAGGAAAGGSAANRDLTHPPTVEVGSGSAPTSLQTEDIVTGTGPVAASGQRVDVQYTGVAWSTRRQFDSSWTRGGQPFSFTLGRGEVIRGWDQGVAGMHVGGRRRIVIPSELGYGARGAGADIGPNETLVFVVDLVGVH